MPIANATENFNLIFPYIPIAQRPGALSDGNLSHNDGFSMQLKETGSIDHFGNKIYSLLLKEKNDDVLSIYFALDFKRKQLIPLEYNNMLVQQQISAFDFASGLITSEKTLIKLDAYFNECLKTVSNKFSLSADNIVTSGIEY